MTEEILIGGSGGQGVLFIGRLLAETGLMEGREVLWLPSYAAEKRGGAVWCNVIISKEPVGDMFITRPASAIAMSPPAFTRLVPMMKTGSCLIVNQSLIQEKADRDDIRTVYIRATEMALEVGDDSVANLVMLGALLAAAPLVAMKNLISVMDAMLAKSKKLELNKRALHKGYAHH